MVKSRSSVRRGPLRLRLSSSPEDSDEWRVGSSGLHTRHPHLSMLAGALVRGTEQEARFRRSRPSPRSLPEVRGIGGKGCWIWTLLIHTPLIELVVAVVLP